MDNASQTAARIAQESERDHLRQTMRQDAAIQRVFAEHPTKFKQSPEQVLRGLGASVKFDADGNPLVDGQPLADRLASYAAVNPVAVAGTVAEQHDGGLSSVRSKQDLDSPQAKASWIGTHGLSAWERLPLTAPQPIDPDKLDWESYRKLPVSQKVRLVEQYGEGFAAKLKAKEQSQLQYQKLVGIPTGNRRA